MAAIKPATASELREGAEAIADAAPLVYVDPFDALRAPFPASQVGQLPKAGITLDYVGHGAVTHRLLEVDPEWTWEPFATDADGLPKFTLDADGNPIAFWIRLTVAGVTRPGVGTCGPKQFDAEKVLVGDALRNSAMRFGVALDLWIRGHGEDDEKVSASNTGSTPNRQQVPAWNEKMGKAHLLNLVKGSADKASDADKGLAAEVWDWGSAASWEAWDVTEVDALFKRYQEAHPQTPATPAEAPPAGSDPIAVDDDPECLHDGCAEPVTFFSADNEPWCESHRPL